jgi:MFS family permease
VLPSKRPDRTLAHRQNPSQTEVSSHRSGLDRLRRPLRALRSRNYRLFFAGQGVSLLGATIQQIALGWYVYRLTGSQVLLGTIGFLNQIPGFLLAPLAGVLSDRVDGRRALLAIQGGLMVQSILMAIAVVTGHGTVPILLGLSLLQGALNAFDLPFRQSVVPRLVDNHKELPSAIALNSALFNVARILGPSMGGILVVSVGEQACFFANGASYLAVLAALCAVKLRPRIRRPPRARILTDIVEGLRYVRHHRPIRDLLVLLAAESFLGLSYIVLFPVLARDALHGDPHTLGFLTGAAGLGSLTAAIRLASRRNLRGLMGSIAFCVALSSGALVLFAFVHSLLPMMALIATAGFGFISVSGAANTIIHTLVDDEMRGRVMSCYTLAFVGFTPFGNLSLGWLAHRWGITQAISFFGLLLLLCGLVFWARLKSLRAATRPIYVDLGILPWQNE